MPEHERNDASVFIHPQAVVDTADVGKGTRIWANAHLLAGCRIGADCNICENTFLESQVTLGDRVTVKCGVYLWNGVTCEDDVFLGPNATFTNDIYPRSKRYLEKPVETFVRKGASIGANATILAGITIGCYAMIGVGSVVVADVPDYGLVFGNPAKLRGFVAASGRPLTIEGNEGVCPETGARYLIDGSICKPLDA
ncbi:MAG: acyltransferase [Candidatus Hydrogenedentales bacterium]